MLLVPLIRIKLEQELREVHSDVAWIPVLHTRLVRHGESYEPILLNRGRGGPVEVCQ
jgi:hypothetical protein